MTSGLVVVSAGTYHLPFDRLSEWTQRWMSTRPGVEVVVQHGPSRSVPGARNHAILPYGELLALCRDADVVVLQGGAGGVMDMRALHVVPIVVPRIPGGGEVVDDHQLVFTEEMAALGLVRRATSYEQFEALLDSALDGTRAETGPDVATPGAAAVCDLLDDDRIRRISVATTLRRGAGSVASAVRRRLSRLRRASR